MRRVVLLLPPYSGPPLGPPAGLLSLAASLIEGGYEVVIIDAAVVPDFLSAVAQSSKGALCFGVSLLTGPMIQGAVAAARLVKNLCPQVPVIFGGWHPSLQPEQTLRESFVDIVVRNQGEITLTEIADRIDTGHGLSDVNGCSIKKDGRIHHNPDRPPTCLNELPPASYHLVDFDAYERKGGGRKLPYVGSVGCPYACNYCTDTVFYKRRFNSLESGRVVSEVTTLVKRHGLSEVALLDSNFLVDNRRALEIAQGFLRSDLSFRWTFQTSTDLLCRLSDDEVCLLGQSGVSHIGFGVESGSEDVLLKMNKSHEHIPDMFETARKCQRAGIRATFNLILGFPGETRDDRSQTLQIMSRIAAEYDNVTFSPNVFTPYPGIPIWKELRALGVREPQSLEEWRLCALGANFLPWLQGPAYRDVERCISFFMLNNEISRAFRRPSLSEPVRLALRAAQRPLRWRMRHNFFYWPVELWLYAKHLSLRRSLLTGQVLGHTLGEAC